MSAGHRARWVFRFFDLSSRASFAWRSHILDQEDGLEIATRLTAFAMTGHLETGAIKKQRK